MDPNCPDWIRIKIRGPRENNNHLHHHGKDLQRHRQWLRSVAESHLRVIAARPCIHKYIHHKVSMTFSYNHNHTQYEAASRKIIAKMHLLRSIRP